MLINNGLIRRTQIAQRGNFRLLRQHEKIGEFWLQEGELRHGLKLSPKGAVLEGLEEVVSKISRLTHVAYRKINSMHLFFVSFLCLH